MPFGALVNEKCYVVAGNTSESSPVNLYRHIYPGRKIIFSSG